MKCLVRIINLESLNIKRFNAATLLTVGAFLFLLFLGTACEPEVDRAAIAKDLMNKALEERIANYKSIRENRCRDGLLREANRLVDSILFVEAKLANDTLDRPPIPLKPIAPEKKVLEDTTPVKPFLPDTIN